MNMPGVDLESFLKLSTESIVKLVQSKGKPQAGVFVPDGNRRLVLSTTDLEEDSEAFLAQVAVTQTFHGLDTLRVFFSHGLPTLFVPMFSRSVLARGTEYCRLSVLSTLDALFTNDTCLDFYHTWNVRIQVYGDLSVLSWVGCEQAIQWIQNIQKITQEHVSHRLFLGIGGEPLVGSDAAKAAIDFHEKHQREPAPSELIESLYGEPVAPADFIIISGKMSGLGALPAFVCDGDTQLYFLPAPGVVALNEQSYRAILYDLLYLHDNKKEFYTLNHEEREELRVWYVAHLNTVIGLGKRIGSVWVPAEL